MLSTKCHPIFRHLQINIVDVFVPSRKCSLEKIAKWPYYYYWSSSMRKYLVFLSDTFSWSPKNGILPRKFVKNGVWSTTYDLVAAAVGVTEIQAFKRFNTRLQFFFGVSKLKTGYLSYKFAVVPMYSKSLIIGILAIWIFLNYLDYWEKFNYHDFSVPIIEVDKFSVVNLKIWLLGIFEISGHPCPDNQGLNVCT